jgi:DNA polymerase III epsilon subunit-like protein
MARDPKKINSYVVIDFETSGLDKKDGLHAQKYAVTEFAGIAINGVTLEEILRYDHMVKPYDSGLIYDPEAAKFTGITKEMCEKDGVPLKQVVEEISMLLKEANLYNTKTAKPILVAHNWDFDRGFLQDIFRRAKVDLSVFVDGDKDAYGNFIPHGIDTMDLAKACWAEVTDTATKFRLVNCCERAAIDVIDGHHAMNDVIPTTDLLRYFLTRLRYGSNDTVVVQGGNVSVHRQLFEW